MIAMKTIFIIGAGRGLGNAVGRKFGTNGFRVVLMARNAESLESYSKEFESEGIEVHTIAVDVSDDSCLRKALSEAVNVYGTPDVVHYNVGITSPDSALSDGVTADVIRDRYQVDVVGAYNAVQQISTEDFMRNKGTILITGGGLAMYPSIDYLPLSMDKAALRAMVQAIHPALESKGVFIGLLTVCNVIVEGSSCDPGILADKFWQMYSERKDWEIICQ